MNAPLCRVAIVGAGYMAREHTRAFASIPGVSLTGIYSRTNSKAAALAKEFGIHGVFGSIAELYEKSKAALVVVSVPELSANQVSKSCFAYPWTVLLEKPAGYNLKDAEDICAAAQEKSSQVYVALNRRFYGSTQKALADLESISGRRFIHVQDQEDIQAALKAGQPKEVADHWMYANSCHVVDYLRLFGRGAIQEVVPIIPWKGPDTDLVLAKVVFESGDVGIYEGIWRGPGPWAVQITTPDKRWELRPLEQAAVQLAGERKLQALIPHPYDQDFKPGLKLQAEYAVKAALGEPTELATINDALETMRLINRIFEK